MNKKGFTLVEVIIAVGLLGIVSLVTMNVVVDILRSAVKSQAIMDVEQTSNFVSLKIENDLEKAYKVEPLPGGSALKITQGSSIAPIIVTYSVLAGADCNTAVGSAIGASCLRRIEIHQGNEFNNTNVLLTDASPMSLTDSNPNKSAVFVFPNGTKSYFEVVGKAVNVSILFKKPNLPAGGTAGAGNFSAQSLLDLTIAVPQI